jgi:Protein of unknown function (DUF3602)
MPGRKVSHGRGGIGNISSDTVEYVDGAIYSPPLMTVTSSPCPFTFLTIAQAKRNPHYSTGRGGAGNVRKYDPVGALIAQDIPDVSGVSAPRAAGRGGYGNYQEMHKRERQRIEGGAELRRSQDSGRSGQSAASTASTTSTISESGFAGWAKERIFGRKDRR